MRFRAPTAICEGWFTLAAKSEAKSESETQGALRSNVIKKRSRKRVGSSTESESEGSEEFLFLLLPSFPIQ